MKENSIEEDIRILEKFKNNEMQRDKLERDSRCGGWKIGDIYKYLELNPALDHILSDYKRVLEINEVLLKENKELKEKWDNDTHKLQNYLNIANAEIIKLQKELNQENKRSMMLAVEKQDYFEKYKYHLQQNERLTKEFSNVIPVQKVKDKIEELSNTKGDFATYIAVSERIKALQELLESEEK